MFERFTDQARQAVVHGQEEASMLRHGYLGTEHLLLGLLRQPEGGGARALRRLGIDLETTRADVVREVGAGTETPDADAEALRAIGIDVEEVRRRIEEAFGPGALDRRVSGRRRRGPGRCDQYPTRLGGRFPFTPRAKKILELSLREAVRLGDASIGTEHILLGIAREERGLAARILASRGAGCARVQAAVMAEIGRGGDPLAGSA